MVDFIVLKILKQNQNETKQLLNVIGTRIEIKIKQKN